MDFAGDTSYYKEIVLGVRTGLVGIYTHYPLQCVRFQVREKTSSVDVRAPQSAVGYIAVVFIAVTLVAMAILDIPSFLHDGRQMVNDIRYSFTGQPSAT